MFDITRAEYILGAREIQSGNLRKIINGPIYDNLTNAQERVRKNDSGVSVTLSDRGRLIASALQLQNRGGTTAAAGFDDFLESMHREILADGEQAAVLSELPESGDTLRTSVAKQAANYILTSLYGKKSIYEGVSSESPFVGLDRKSLSKIAFDDSGSFTSIERFVAFLDMTSRDVEFQNRAFDLQSSMQSKTPGGPWHQVLSMKAHAEMASQMSEAEKAWRNWGSPEDMRVLAEQLASQSKIEVPDLPSYSDVGGDDELLFIAAVKDRDVLGWLGLQPDRSKSDSVQESLVYFIPRKGLSRE